jgi:hypothetical protein
MISTNFLPKDPVPPVTSTTCSDQFIFSSAVTFSGLAGVDRHLRKYSYSA